MTDLPTLKLKALVNFPANAFGRFGVNVAKQDGAFYLDIDYSLFVPATVLPSVDIPNLHILLWNAVSNVYILAPLSLIGQIFTQGNLVVVTAGGALIGANDSVIAVKKSPGSVTPLTLGSAALKQGTVHISDVGMNSGTFPITITPAGADTINGLSSWTIAGDGASVTLYPLPGIGWTL
jgi:hypothetical protein